MSARRYFLGILALCSPTLAGAQETPTITAKEAIAEMRALYSVAEQKTHACADTQIDPNTIIVCEEIDDPARYMSVLPEERSSEDPNLPRAPSVSGMPAQLSVGTSVRGCLLQCPPETAILIDLEAIPEAPAGSDAARYSEVP